MLKLLIFLTMFAILLCSTSSIIPVKKPVWLRHLTRYIKRDRNIYEAMLLINEDSNSTEYRINDIVMSFSSHLLTTQVSFEKATKEMAHNLSLLSHSSDPKATLFVVDQFSKQTTAQQLHSSKLNDAINFIAEFSQSRSRPKCLIFIQKEDNATIKKLLRMMWRIQFLDVTLVELIQEELSRYISSKLDHELAMIHYYIPFSDTYIKKRYSHKIEWFPNKLLDLNGHQLKVALFDVAPYVSIIRNETGSVIEIRGQSIDKLKVLSKVLNFRIVNVFVSKEDWYSPAGCKKEDNDGFFKKIIDNEIQLIAYETTKTGSCQEKLVEIGKGIHFGKYTMLIPILSNQKSVLTVEWKLMNIIILISPLLLVLISSRLLHFNPQNWRLTYLLQILLGLSVPREPAVLIERIVFGSALIAALLHSSFIYTAFTSVCIEKTTNLEIRTLEELLASDLTPMVQVNYFHSIFNESDGYLRRLLIKANVNNKDEEFCVKELLEQRKITCLMRDDRAKFLTREINDVYGNPVMKILDEGIENFFSGTILEAASPYIRRLDQVTLRILEIGLVDLWDKRYFTHRSNDEYDRNTFFNSTRSESSLIRRQMFYVLLLGFVFSFLVFVCEIIMHLYRSRQ